VRPRIAVIDDEENIRELLDISLSLAHFDVRCAPDASRGLSLVRDWEPNCIVLDIMMPKMDGIAMLPLIRRLTDVPILLLTAKGDVQDRIEGLEAGADDYLAKPFDAGELVARINTALRRPALEHVDFVRVGDLEIDRSARAVTRGNRPIELTARQFDLLTTLARRPGRVFSRSELIDLVWGTDADISTATVDTFVSYIRAKVDGPGERRLVQTIRGVGFSLRAE
jgi:DNA-binding response OmpR family regulator